MSSQTDSLLFKVEQEVARLLLVKLEKFNITFERASQIAKFILAHLPETMTDEQVMKILPSLDDDFIELAEIVHKHIFDYEEKYKEERFKGAVGSQLLKAIDVIDAWKVYYDLIKKTTNEQNTNEQNNNTNTERARLFWNKVLENYSNESPELIVTELLEKSYFGSGMDDESQEFTKQIIQETFGL